jgi:hypothetical protein
MNAPNSGSGHGGTPLAAILLLGTILLGAGAAFHPMLPGDLAGQLAIIAHTSSWRLIHLVMLAGSGLVMIGVWGQLGSQPPAARLALGVVFVVIVSGLALNASNIAFMAQTGTGDATRFVQGQTGAAAGFALGHEESLLRARFGNCLVAVGCLALAMVLGRDRRQPRYMVWLAAVGAIGGIVGVAVFDPASRGAVAAVALFCVWAAIAAARTLWSRWVGDPSARSRTLPSSPVAAGQGKNNL